jgi:hypothetical protein
MDAWDGDTRRAGRNPETFAGSMHQPIRFFHRKAATVAEERKEVEKWHTQAARAGKSHPGALAFIENILCVPLRPPRLCGKPF